jgi:hypothetical protein
MSERSALRRRLRLHLFTWLTVPLAVGALLAWGRPGHALPVGGPREPPDCAADITGSLTANPTVIDRETSTAAPRTTLTWSLSVPHHCLVSAALSLQGVSVAPSGSMSFAVSQTQTFNLLLTNLHRTAATVRVNVLGDPGFITVSSGRQVAADDVTKFNQQWMQPFERNAALDYATSTLSQFDPDGVWGNGERMAALVRMYELTFDTRYLDHLRELAQLALTYRDDLPYQPPGVARPVEQIRNLVGVPAWGGANGESGGLHRDEEIVSSLYAYPIAAFARIVAENPSLQAKYGDDAVQYANRVAQTVAYFLPQIHTERVGQFLQATFRKPEEYASRPSAADCDAAYNTELKMDPANQSRWSQQRSDCNLLRALAGRDQPHNYNLTFAMVLIELSRAVDTTFFHGSTKHSTAAEVGRDVYLLTAIRIQRYFASHMQHDLVIDRLGTAIWNYAENQPSGHEHVEDLDHGSMDMNYVDVLQRNYDRLNLAAQRFNEPLAPPATQGFARTFLLDTQGTDFAQNIVGKADSPPYLADSRCEGWVALARVDSTIYRRCHDVSLRVVGTAQPHLNIGNHSSLLATKVFAPE